MNFGHFLIVRALVTKRWLVDCKRKYALSHFELLGQLS